jgi:hypothetical protein
MAVPAKMGPALNWGLAGLLVSVSGKLRVEEKLVQIESLDIVK